MRLVCLGMHPKTDLLPTSHPRGPFCINVHADRSIPNEQIRLLSSKYLPGEGGYDGYVIDMYSKEGLFYMGYQVACYLGSTLE